MARLIDRIEQSEKAKSAAPERKSAVINKMTQQAGAKDKMISVKVNSSTYKVFTDICRARGLSNNSAINMLISDFVNDNKSYLEDV